MKWIILILFVSACAGSAPLADCDASVHGCGVSHGMRNPGYHEDMGGD